MLCPKTGAHNVRLRNNTTKDLKKYDVLQRFNIRNINNNKKQQQQKQQRSCTGHIFRCQNAKRENNTNQPKYEYK